MKLLVVTKGCYSDYRIKHIFADGPLAAEFVERYNSLLTATQDVDYDGLRLEEWETTETMPSLFAHYVAFVDYHDQVVCSAYIDEEDDYPDLPPVGPVQGDDLRRVYVQGRDRHRVLKAAQDRVAFLRAREAGLT